jgi:hypothetical protein
MISLTRCRCTHPIEQAGVCSAAAAAVAAFVVREKHVAAAVYELASEQAKCDMLQELVQVRAGWGSWLGTHCFGLWFLRWHPHCHSTGGGASVSGCFLQVHNALLPCCCLH